jgi:hypothetical protein
MTSKNAVSGKSQGFHTRFIQVVWISNPGMNRAIFDRLLLQLNFFGCLILTGTSPSASLEVAERLMLPRCFRRHIQG